MHQKGIILLNILSPIYKSNEVQYIMMTSWNGNIFRVTGYLCGEFTGLRWIPRTKASDVDVFFDLRLDKQLGKQSWDWWFETPSCPLWRHRNVATYEYEHARCLYLYNVNQLIDYEPWKWTLNIMKVRYIVNTLNAMNNTKNRAEFQQKYMLQHWWTVCQCHTIR